MIYRQELSLESHLGNNIMELAHLIINQQSDQSGHIDFLFSQCTNQYAISVRKNFETKRFLFHLISYVGNYEPTCIVTIKMVPS